jgi:ribonuclease HI
MTKFICYADGSCFDNGLPTSRGGWAYVILSETSTSLYEASGEESPSTNNRMELMAVIKALESLPENSIVEVRTDSQYVINGFAKKWIDKWKADNYMLASGVERKNSDLWRILDVLYRARQVSFVWVKGHSGVFHNEYVDLMAYEAWKNK